MPKCEITPKSQRIVRAILRLPNKDGVLVPIPEYENLMAKGNVTIKKVTSLLTNRSHEDLKTLRKNMGETNMPRSRRECADLVLKELVRQMGN